MCNSRSCLADTSDGAPIRRSSARWFIGNSDLAQVGGAAQKHHDAIDAGRHAAMRRGAVLECAVHAAEAFDHVGLAIPAISNAFTIASGR
jgi:hypothetical protein